MLNKNPNLVYYLDVFKCLSGKNQSEFMSLIEKAKENCNDRQKKFFLDGIVINKSEFILKHLDENIYYMFVNFINKRIREIRDKFTIDYFRRVLNANLDNIKKDNNRFPFIFLIILIENFVEKEELYNFLKNADIIINIVDSIFIKTAIYNIYIDESGNPDNVKDIAFIVGGYYIKNIESKDWTYKLINKFNELKEKYKNQDSINKIYHRTELKRHNINLAYDITRDIINFIRNDIKIVYIYDEKPSDITNSKHYYITLVSTLIAKLLYNILINEVNINDTKIVLNINIAKRQNLNRYGNNLCIKEDEFMNFLEKIIKENIQGRNIIKNFDEEKYKFLIRSQIEDSEIKSGIENNLEQLKIKYGLLNDNIETNIAIGDANKDKNLVISDYLCNLFYSSINNKYSEKEAELFNSIENKISLKILYSFFDKDIDFYFNKKDYYNIIDSYIFYKKISLNSKLNNSTIKNSNIYIDRLINYCEDDNHKNKYRYIILAIKSILEKIEYESNSLKNYDNIIVSYNMIIDFIEKISFSSDTKYDKRLKNSIIFIINTDKLAVFNHSEDHENAYKIIEENNNILPCALSDAFTKDRVVLFDILRATAQWHIYDANSCIRLINENLENIESLSKNNFIDEIGKLYGTLGQAYIIHYYITDDILDLEKAKFYFNKAIENFKHKKEELIREYSYLQNLSIILEDNDSFIEYTKEYLKLANINVSDKLTENIAYYLNNHSIDKDYEFFLIRLLKYCNTFNTDISKDIFNLIINNNKIIPNINNINSVEHIDILKEYTLLCCKNNKNINYMYDCHKFMENQKGYFNDMRKLSLYIIEILMDNDSNFNEALKIIEYLYTISEYYKQAFSSILDESKINNLNKKEWALKVRNKLYM